jgi:hypothetical protein
VPNFVAKLIAGGLSAAVILVWWPTVFPGDSVASWLARGVAWTLAFELFAHAFTPLERALWETTPGKRLRDRATRQDRGLPLGRSATLACSALAVVGALLSFAPDQPQKRVAAAPKRVTEVQRVVRVVRRPVEVTRVVSAEHGSAPRASAVPPPAHTAAPVRSKPADRSAPRPTSSPRRQEQPVKTPPAAPAPEVTAPPAGDQAEPVAEPGQQVSPRLFIPS